MFYPNPVGWWCVQTPALLQSGQSKIDNGTVKQRLSRCFSGGWRSWRSCRVSHGWSGFAIQRYPGYSLVRWNYRTVDLEFL